MRKTKILLLLLTIFLAGCWSSTSGYEGIRFPKTSAGKLVFQETNIPDNCSAFAHVLMSSKMQSTGKGLHDALVQEAGDKGANLILVGMAREMPKEELEENSFDYYGPEYAYNFKKTWLGWKFGFDEWNKGKNLIGLDAAAWENNEISFKNSLLIQAVFLRCGQDL